jgi:hypothetical protein
VIRCVQKNLNDKRYAVVEVEDNGPGFDAAMKDKLGAITLPKGGQKSYAIQMSQYMGINKASKNIERAMDAVSNDVDELDSKVCDWARWNDTYAFIEDCNKAYMESNIVAQSFANLRVDLMLFVNAADAMPTGGTLVLKTRNVTHQDIPDIRLSLNRSCKHRCEKPIRGNDQGGDRRNKHKNHWVKGPFIGFPLRHQPRCHQHQSHGGHQLVGSSKKDPEVLPPSCQDQDQCEKAGNNGPNMDILKDGLISPNNSEVATRINRITSCRIVTARIINITAP